MLKQTVNMNLDVATIIKKGRGVNLLYKGCTHRKDGSSGGKQYWRCTERTGCKGRVHTSTDTEDVRVLMYTDHDSHLPDETKIVAVTAKAKLCDLACNNPLKPLKQLYRDFITSDEAPESDVLMPVFQGCSTQMHRSRHENFPTLPKTREEVQHLRLLAESQIIFVDGTFKADPPLYRQLLTIHGLYCRHTMPLVYCLLADKKRESYYDCLDHVKRRMVTLDIVFNPPKILCDFEVGLISALRSQFPNASTKGCYFHHTKAIWAKVQDLGLVTEYNTNREIRQQVRGLMSLAFLPVILIGPNFMLIETSETTQASPALQQLCTYYQETWLNGNYPLSLWNVSTETVRTNNSVEGWHNKLNRTIGKIHPNIFELLQHTKKEQRETEVISNQARLGASPPRRR